MPEPASPAVIAERRGHVLVLTMARIKASEDAHEGPLAFAEKRAPVWKAR